MVCLFCTNIVVLANTDILAPIVGNPEVYKAMQGMMEERLAVQQKPASEPFQPEFALKLPIIKIDQPGAVIFNPKLNFVQGKSLDTTLINTTRSAEEVRALLKNMPRGTKLFIKGHLRGVDGPGSSLDLPEFQIKLTPQGSVLIEQIPSTPTLASEFSVTVQFELLPDKDDSDVIEYVAPDYGITQEKPYRVKGGVKLNTATEDTPWETTPNGQKDGPAFIFRNVFGLGGIRIICADTDAMALAGGMESSNVFNVALIAAASMLSGANLSQADIFSLAVKLENNEFKGLTGGQGHLCCMLGGAYRHLWLSGLTDNAGELVNPYAALSVPFLSEGQLSAIEDHMFLVQAGKEFENGEPKVKRTASLINYMWTDLLRYNDAEGLRLHQQKIALAGQYTKALQEGKFEDAVTAVNRYVDIRDELCRRWMGLVIDHHLGRDAPEYVKKYFAPKVFDRSNEYYEFYDVVRNVINKMDERRAEGAQDYETIAKNTSFYTYEGTGVLVQKARKEGIAIMPLGAGGPGANLVAISARGSAHLKSFLEREGIWQFTAEKAEEAKKIIRGFIKTGTIRGYMQFKVGREGLKIGGFDSLTGIRVPEGPVQLSKVVGTKAAPDWWLKRQMGGILCPLFSGKRQGDQGIGDLKWLESFIDFMSKQDADFLVQLPTTQINPTDSCPYVSISLFANNAICYLPLDELISAKEMSNYQKEFVKMSADADMAKKLNSALSAQKIDYAIIVPYKEYCLRQEFEKLYPGIALGDNSGFNAYVKENKDWIEDYSLFHSLLNYHNGRAWWEWDRQYKERDAEALKAYSQKNKKEILFYQYLQWLYYSRWQKVRAYSREKNKFIIGDAPIYPAPNSADVWVNQDIFDMAKNAGAPAEPIAPDGQNWGTHPYRWDENYYKVIGFWEKRIRYMARFYDGIRIDHLLGLCSEWLIDVGQHPKTGKFYPESLEAGAAMGEKILRHLAKAAEEENILLIGEDIGYRDHIIREMIDNLSLELPNLFLYNPVGWRQKHMANRPHTMVVDATHDTPATFAERYDGLHDGDRGQVRDFLDVHGIQPVSEDANHMEEQVIAAMERESFYCLTLQTIVGERDAQVNVPGEVGPHNWSWRAPPVEELLKMEHLGYFPKPASATKEVIGALPQEWLNDGNKFNAAEFIKYLSSLPRNNNRILEQDKTAFIFSENVTFANGLGVLLPKLVKSGMKVAVIATNDKERALIDELNQNKPDDERIIYADTIIEARIKAKTARYYYFKVNGDPDTDLYNVTTFDITDIVKKIIDAIGKVSGIVERERLELLHEAARKFAQAA
ncbi:MAG: 4-alpha-glucanotransferase [Candidatus Omnitrophica bacterium]|nr:4-alpha-glucanotransferase [Candidatus Omnitrophota bacterium]